MSQPTRPYLTPASSMASAPARLPLPRALKKPGPRELSSAMTRVDVAALASLYVDRHSSSDWLYAGPDDRKKGQS